MRYMTGVQRQLLLLSNLDPTQRKWNINISRYSQHQDNATPDVQSTNEDLNLELETLTKEKGQLQKVSTALIVGSLCCCITTSLVAIKPSVGQFRSHGSI